MSLTPDEILYPLLPSFYRQGDLDAGEPLRALLAVLERELRLVDANISRSYENWFIETCEDWVVPYLAELLGVRQLPTLGSAGFNQRTYVANILPYRRRKGTASVLPQLGRDLTGWPVRLVEYFRLVATCQSLRLPARPGTIDLRVSADLRHLNGAFDSVSHTDEVRNIPRHSGRYNLPSIGLFVWRLRSYRMPLTSAGVIDGTLGYFTFDPAGRDVPLFNPDRTQAGVAVQESDAPAALTRSVLDEDLRGPHLTPPLPLRYFGADPVVTVFYNGGSTPVPASKILIADLSGWSAPFDTGGLFSIAIDPQLGRLAFSPTLLGGLQKVKVTYSYGFSSDLGGGPYERLDPQAPAPAAVFPVCVSDSTRGDADLATALGKLTTRWATDQTNPVVVEIRDSESYSFPKKLSLPAGMQLVIRAANRQRPALRLDPSTVPAAMPPTDSGLYLGDLATLTIDGLLLGSGILRVYAGKNNRLSLSHSTLRPAQYGTAPYPSVQVLLAGTSFALDVSRCITGPLWLPKQDSALTVADSIIDGSNVAAPWATVDADSASIQRTTVRGRTTVNLLPLASDSLFTDVVRVARTQPGCLRFCYVPSAETGDPAAGFSVTPARYRCQPDGVLFGVQDGVARRLLRAQLVPVFTSTACGQPGYAQLSFSCSDQLRRGASDEGEMGSFFELHQPQREANLTAGLEEFLRLGYEAGVFFLN